MKCERPISMLKVRYDSPLVHPSTGDLLEHRCDECAGCRSFYAEKLRRLANGIRLTTDERAGVVALLHLAGAA